MKRWGYYFPVIFSALMMVGLVGCGQEAPKTVAPKAAAPSAPAAPSKSVTESTGQAVVDTIKNPMDKARGVEGTLEKAAGKTADQIKDVAP